MLVEQPFSWRTEAGWKRHCSLYHTNVSLEETDSIRCPVVCLWKFSECLDGLIEWQDSDTGDSKETYSNAETDDSDDTKVDS